MFTTTTLLTYIAAAFALVLAPGPAQALVLANSISNGRRAGIVTTLGLNVGTLVHTIAAALGLSAILATSVLAFSVVKYVGAAYLIYLGVKAIRDRSANTDSDITEKTSKTIRQTFTRAIAVGILNPKVALFFMAFLPQFVDPARGAVVLQFMVLGIILAGIAVAWDSVLASVAGRLGSWFARNPRFTLWRQRITGGMMLALGVRLAFAQRD
jgi:RhtB (resistance to homoserine/threonine) family protein